MNRLVKKILVVSTFIGMVFGIIGNPIISRAFTFNYPASTVYVEYKDQKGNDFPVSLGMDGVYVTFLGATSLGDDPLTITKIGGQNVFALDIPAFNRTVGSGQRLQSYVANLKITTPLPYVKSFVSIPTDSSLPTMNKYSRYREVDGVPWQQSLPLNQTHTKQVDNTFNFPLDGSYFHRSIDKDMTVGASTSVFVDGLDGDTLRFYANFYQIKEVFEDHLGASIPAPSGYTNGNLVDITAQPFGYQMVNDSALPQTYVNGSFFYKYKGWYKGSGNGASINTTYPPSINFSATTVTESTNEVHIVYEKKALRIVNEEYIDTSSGTIEPSWNNMGQTRADGDTFTQIPAQTKTDSSGVVWEYQGWKLDSEPMSAMRPESTPVSVYINANKTIQYVYKKKQHTITTKYVDRVDGTTLIPMSTSNPDISLIDDSDSYGSPAPFPPITDASGNTWDWIGWENFTDAPGILNSTNMAINNIKGNKELRYHYQARNTTANLDLNPTPQVVASGGTVAWSSRLTNTGTSTLNNLTLKATSNWASGLSAPTQVTVTPAGGAPQNFTISPVDWAGGFNLTGVSIPSGGANNYADITFTDTATGAVNQVLPAEIEIDGNMASPLTAENFVRIDDPDEPNLNPTGNAGLVNIPDFRFGDVEVKPYAQTKGLDAASYQGSYNPYIRFKDQESLSGWSLTAKLGQFTSGSKTLPATTSIELNNGSLKEVQNYNKHNESLSGGTSVGNKSIPSDSTTVALTNGAAQGVYQLDYAFNDVELELLAHSGIAGLSYTANMDWTLTTTP